MLSNFHVATESKAIIKREIIKYMMLKILSNLDQPVNDH